MSNNNDFENPTDDFDQEFADGVGQDGDFGEFEDKKSGSIAQSIKQNPIMKFGLVAGVIIVVILIFSLFSGPKEETKNSFVPGGDKNFKEAPGTKEVSPEMKQALEEKNQQRIDEAQKQGTSVIPTPIEPPKALLDVPDDVVNGEDPLLRWKQMQEERAKAQREQKLTDLKQNKTDPERDAKVQGLAGNMSTQMGDILGKGMKDKDFMQHMIVFDIEKLKKNTSQARSASAGSGGDLPEANGKKNTVIIPAGKLEYAQMLLEANSDIPGPVVALLSSGPLSGSKLMGSFKSEDEYLVINFKTLITKKGTTVPIEAVAIDPETSLTGVATDVDHKYFSRIILPAAAKFVEGLGDAYAQTTETVSQSASTTTTTKANMNTEQEFGKAVSEAAKEAGDVLSDDAKNDKPLVRVRAGTPVGILFTNSLTDEAILKARSGIVSPQGTSSSGTSQSSMQQPMMMMNNPSMGGLNPMQQLQNGMQNQQFLQQGN